jgi:hypothetical protein
MDPFPGVYTDPLSLHDYLYARASPPNLTDPTGKISAGVSAFATGAVIGGILGGFDAWLAGGDVGFGVGVGAVSGALLGPLVATGGIFAKISILAGTTLGSIGTLQAIGEENYKLAVFRGITTLVSLVAIPRVAAALKAKRPLEVITSPENSVAGDEFAAIVHTRKGPVKVEAIIGIDSESSTLFLRNLSVFSGKKNPPTGLQRDLFAARSQLVDLASSLGFKRLKITGIRVAEGTTANPGKKVDISINLARSKKN